MPEGVTSRDVAEVTAAHTPKARARLAPSKLLVMSDSEPGTSSSCLLISTAPWKIALLSCSTILVSAPLTWELKRIPVSN